VKKGVKAPDKYFWQIPYADIVAVQGENDKQDMTKNSADQECDAKEKHRLEEKFFCDVTGNYPIHHDICQKYLGRDFRQDECYKTVNIFVTEAEDQYVKNVQCYPKEYVI
jgi:hypothetical protein